MNLQTLETPKTELLDTAFLADRFRTLIEQWLANIDVAPTTKSTYRRGMNRFLSWLPLWGQSLNGFAIRTWREDLRAEGHKPLTVNTWLAGVRSFFNWALENGLVPYDPTAGVRGMSRRGTSQAHKRDELTGPEVLAVLDTCPRSLIGRRDRAILALMAYCALRQVEVHRADLQDLRTRDDRLVLWVQGKGHEEKDTFVVLPHFAEEVIRQWLTVRPPEGKALFVGIGNRHQGRLSRKSIRRMVKKRYHAAGVVGDSKSTHSLRHSAISSAIRNGAEIQDVQAMARHTNINTTMIYYHETNRTSKPEKILCDMIE